MRIRFLTRATPGRLAALCLAGALGLATGPDFSTAFAFPAPKAPAAKTAPTGKAAPSGAAAAKPAAQVKPAALPSHPLDQFLAKDNNGRDSVTTDVLDDLPFLRRVTADLIGRIPTTAEIDEFLALPAATRRVEWIDRLMREPRFVDRWTAFYSDLLRVRTNTD
ncbi:MAG TPA: DUF1549 domain-containing protein, partial [Pirellulales bacterium]